MTDTPTPEALADPLLAELRRLAERAIEWDPPWDLVTYGLAPAAKEWVDATHPEKVLALLDAAARVAALEQSVRTLGEALVLAHDHHGFSNVDCTPANCSAEAALVDAGVERPDKATRRALAFEK